MQKRDQGREIPSGATIALTGVNTSLGRSLVAALERQRRWRRIVVVDVANAPTAGPRTVFHEVDLTQPAIDARLAEVFAAERVDTVVHAAFLSAPTHASAWAHELEAVGTMHVLGACEAARVRKLVLSSQTILYGAHADTPLYLTEDHPLRGDARWPFIATKLDAERQVADFAARVPRAIVTVLRTAPTVGPTSRNVVTRLLRRRLVPTVLGYDPLVQFIHERDVATAFGIAAAEDHPGVFNIVAPGVLTLTTALRLAGRLEVPVPHTIARASLEALFATRVVQQCPVLLDYLRFPCVASGEKAERLMGFRAVHTTREALARYVTTLRDEADLPQGAVSTAASIRGAA